MNAIKLQSLFSFDFVCFSQVTVSDISAMMGTAREYDPKEEIFCKVRESSILYMCIIFYYFYKYIPNMW